jgi:hypothetical protein
MTIRPVASRRLDEKFVERASTVLLRGFSGARSRFASSLRCSMGLPLGSQARERRRVLCIPDFHVSAARGRHLYRSYEDPQASLSNSYALLGTLMAPTRFTSTRFNGRKEKCHG